MKPQYITNDQGVRTGVILTIEEYESLLNSPSTDNLELNDEGKKVLDKRLEDYYLNKDDGKDWEVIKAEILK